MRADSTVRPAVRSSGSAGTGTAPIADTDSHVAMKVNDGTITSSPGRTPRARSASDSASRPEATPRAPVAPIAVANSDSNDGHLVAEHEAATTHHSSVRVVE